MVTKGAVLLAAMLVLAMGLLGGCGRAIDERRLSAQVESELSHIRAACDIGADYKGVAEGDSDTAYVVYGLRQLPNGAEGAVDVELAVRYRAGEGWEVDTESLNKLVSVAATICSEGKSGKEVGQ